MLFTEKGSSSAFAVLPGLEGDGARSTDGQVRGGFMSMQGGGVEGAGAAKIKDGAMRGEKRGRKYKLEFPVELRRFMLWFYMKYNSSISCFFVFFYNINIHVSSISYSGRLPLTPLTSSICLSVQQRSPKIKHNEYG